MKVYAKVAFVYIMQWNSVRDIVNGQIQTLVIQNQHQQLAVGDGLSNTACAYLALNALKLMEQSPMLHHVSVGLKVVL